MGNTKSVESDNWFISCDRSVDDPTDPTAHAPIGDDVFRVSFTTFDCVTVRATFAKLATDGVGLAGVDAGMPGNDAGALTALRGDSDDVSLDGVVEIDFGISVTDPRSEFPEDLFRLRSLLNKLTNNNS